MSNQLVWQCLCTSPLVRNRKGDVQDKMFLSVVLNIFSSSILNVFYLGVTLPFQLYLYAVVADTARAALT